MGCSLTPRHTTMSPRTRNTITSVSLLFFLLFHFSIFPNFSFLQTFFVFFTVSFLGRCNSNLPTPSCRGPFKSAKVWVTEKVVLGAMADPGGEVPHVVQQFEELPGVRELQQLGPRAQSKKERVRVHVNSTPHTSHFLFDSHHFQCHIDIGSSLVCVAHFISSHPHALMMWLF